MKKIDTLEPDFKEKVIQLLQAAEGVTGRKWVVTCGRRTMADQVAVYAQGRTTPGSIVSNAKPGSSAHNYGLAADLAPMKLDGSGLDWTADRAIWENMADIAEEMGLTAGAHFRTITDFPHVEMPRWKEQQALWKSGSIHLA